MFENIYGLTCVENQTLDILRQSGEPIEVTYHDCAVSLQKLFEAFVVRGVKPEHFEEIARVQDVLKDLDVLWLFKMHAGNTEGLRNAIWSCEDNEFILMRIHPDFVRDVLRARGFRPDHYALIRAYGKGFSVHNDIPDTTVVLSAEQLENVYDDDYFRMTVLREITEEDEHNLWGRRQHRPEYYKPFVFIPDNLDGIADTGVKLRDLTGVYKLLRCRMAEYYGRYVDTSFMRDLMPKIEKYYAMFEYYNLKKNTSFEKFLTLFRELIHTDAIIMQELKNRLEGLRLCTKAKSIPS